MLTHSRLFLMIVLVTGCATTAGSTSSSERVVAVDERTGTTVRTQSETTPSATIAAPPDKVWEAVVSSYAMLKVNLTHVNRPAGEVGNRRFVMSRSFFNRPVSAYLNCGDDPLAGPNADSYPVTASFVTRVRAEGTGTVIETSLSGLMSKGGASSGEVYCSTTGALERQFAAMVASRIASP